MLVQCAGRALFRANWYMRQLAVQLAVVEAWLQQSGELESWCRSAAAAAMGRGRHHRDPRRDDDAAPATKLATRVCMWEFGQNDAKRDSGSKLVRLGLARTQPMKKAFNGIVLSSEAASVVSPADRGTIEAGGVAASTARGTAWTRSRLPRRQTGTSGSCRSSSRRTRSTTGGPSR
ncbi:ribosome biogenesis protein [Aureococcus anophagefferens]|uniref:Ribosome biogenesis protein n=1 Tax=Aureococcus anophagefferens TaxID=44056 RepID=A0ABR1GDY6_AURAN